MSYTKAVATALATLSVVLASIVGCAAPVAAPPRIVSSTSLPAPSRSEQSGHIAQLVNSVPVVAQLPNVPGYQRSCKAGKGCVFGPAWADTQRTGCDTRNRVLAAQLTNVVFKPGTRDCKVIAGVLHDPYTGATLTFGVPAKDKIEIDHVYPLARAWDAGAARWAYDRRLQFANDTENLLAVSGAENGHKSDSGPSGWLPPNRQFTCRYLEIYLGVAAKYQLAITEKDKSVAESNCPS
ncbi:HNH endonuclease family protein [Mycobacterium asiaticum]|uniref:HNH endonuclease family protein n=1 Tax=Mycobacterium asiaticum TaxID=1790 RepID=UPI0020A609F0|nr:HNH endonuclease family protein [Mycobacterium asiaticum]